MQTPNAPGSRSGAKYCLGHAGALLRERRDGLGGRDGFLHVIGIGDEHHRACIHDVLLERGIDLYFYNVKPEKQGAIPRQNDRSPRSRAVAPSDRSPLPFAWKHMRRSYPSAGARGHQSRGRTVASKWRRAARSVRAIPGLQLVSAAGRQVARPETVNIARLKSAFEDCFWSKDISGDH